MVEAAIKQEIVQPQEPLQNIAVVPEPLLEVCDASPSVLQGVYRWLLRQAERPYAVLMLALIAFIGSAFFVLPADVMLIPMVLAAPRKAVFFVLAATLSSLAGSLAGYGIGALMFDNLAAPILEFYHATEEFQNMAAFYQEWGAAIVFVAAFSPIPYLVITISSGAASVPLTGFILAVLVGRGLRFGLVALIMSRCSAPVQKIMEKHLGKISLLLLAVLVMAMAAIAIFRS